MKDHNALKKLEIKNFEKRKLRDDYHLLDSLKKSQSNKYRIWAWQHRLLEPSERITANARVKKIDFEKKYFDISPLSDGHFLFEQDQPFYLYFENDRILMTLDAQIINEDFCRFTLPKEVSIMENSFLDELKFFEKEDEEKYKRYRKAPRVKAQGQSVELIKARDPYRKKLYYKLYDISSGGIGLDISDPTIFESGEKISISQIGKKFLIPPLKARINSIREMDQSYKVGIEFDVQEFEK